MLQKNESRENSSMNRSRPAQSSAIRKRRKRNQRIRRMKRLAMCVITVFLLCAGITVFGKADLPEIEGLWSGESAEREQAENFLKRQGDNTEEYPEELLELLEKNPETYDFVTSYPDRSKYQGKTIDISDEVKEGQVPLFLQWDRRWGYDIYGSEMIALAGCGPTCMSMAYVQLTGDIRMNPKAMAEFADEHGYNTEAGTSWSFFTDGAAELGLEGYEIGLDETKMKSELEQGNLIICSMRPGDFTTTGHIILIRGYDKDGFLINDPNSKARSGQHWDFDTLYSQIKCLWAIGV